MCECPGSCSPCPTLSQLPRVPREIQPPCIHLGGQQQGRCEDPQIRISTPPLYLPRGTTAGPLRRSADSERRTPLLLTSPFAADPESIPAPGSSVPAPALPAPAAASAVAAAAAVNSSLRRALVGSGALVPFLNPSRMCVNVAMKAFRSSGVYMHRRSCITRRKGLHGGISVECWCEHGPAMLVLHHQAQGPAWREKRGGVMRTWAGDVGSAGSGARA